MRAVPATRSATGQVQSRDPRTLWVSLGLIALTVLVYFPVAHHGFVNLDDAQYVGDNPEVAAGLTWRGVAWAFTTGHAGNWHPLTWLSHMLDVELFGLDPGPHHLVNLAFHVASTTLLFLLLHRMTGSLHRSAWVAALFAVHPLHVESVAWVAERKDVLSTFLALVTLRAYLAFVRQPKTGRYLVVVVLYAAGLLAKPMLVTLPFVLLLLDFWPLRRAAPGSFGRPIVEKLPLLALAVASSVVTFVVQQQAGAVRGLDVLPFARRAANALVAYVSYAGQMVWPSRLAVVYPYPQSLPGWRVAAAAVLLVTVSVLAVRWVRRHPYLLAGWLWYLGTLVPVIGLVQVGSQPMADRYTYVPLVGLFLMVAWGVPELLARWPPRRLALTVAAGLSVAGCAIAAHRQVHHWSSGVALWEHAIQVTADNHRAHQNLAHALAGQGRGREAIPHYLEALRIRPDNAEAHNNLGSALADEGRVAEAIEHYRAALRSSPDYADAHNNLGVALVGQGRPDEAIRHLAEALRISPERVGVRDNLANARNALGNALAGDRRLDEGIAEYAEALRLKPDLAAAHNGLGVALALQGRVDEAIVHYREASRITPDSPEPRVNAGRALAGLGRTDEAIHELLEALRVNSDQPDVQYDVAVLFARKGMVAEAIRHLETALRLDPGHPAARRARDLLRGRAARKD